MIRTLAFLLCMLPFAAQSAVVTKKVDFAVPFYQAYEYNGVPQGPFVNPNPFDNPFTAIFTYDNALGSAGNRSIIDFVFTGLVFSEELSTPLGGVDGFYNEGSNRLDVIAYNAEVSNFCQSNPKCDYFVGMRDGNLLVDIGLDGIYSESGYDQTRNVFAVRRGNYTVSAVPLPPAMLLFGSALLGLGVLRRLKRQ